MARKLLERYSQIAPLTEELTKDAFIPTAQPDPAAPTMKFVYRVPMDSYYGYVLEKLENHKTLENMVNVGNGVIKDPDTGELMLDKEYLDSVSIPIDILDLTIIGDVRTNTFPFAKGTNQIQVTEDIYLLIDHKRGVVPKGTVFAVPVGGTIYCYVERRSDTVRMYTISTKPTETFTRTVAAKVTNVGGVITITGKPYSRFGLHRISRLPVGSSASGSTGSAAAPPSAFWLKEQY